MQADGTNKHANTNLFVWFTEEPPAGEDSHMLQRDLRLHIEPENTGWGHLETSTDRTHTHPRDAAETTPKVDEIEGSLL
jgi:hypothetical protein